MRSSSTRVRLTSTFTAGRAGGRIGGLFQGLEKWLYGPTLGQSSSCLAH